MSINIEKSFKFIFADPDWHKKMGILAIMFSITSLISYIKNPCLAFMLAITGMAVSCIYQGYFLQSAQNEIKSKSEILPAWEDIGSYFITGVAFLFASFLYFLPIFLLSIPLVVAGISYAASLANKGGVAPSSVDFSAFGPVAVLLGLAAVGILLILLLIMPFITMSFAENFRFKDAFNLKKILGAIFNNFADYLVSAVLAFGMLILLSIILGIFQKSIIMVILTAILAPYYNLVVINLFAQTYKQSLPIAVQSD